MPAAVPNNPPSSFLAALVDLNVRATTTVADPLGRRDSSGGALTVPLYSLASKYLGYSNMNTFHDASGNSSFHSGLVSYRWQASHFTMYTNFRRSKSLDNAANSSPDKNSLTT